MGEVGSDLPYVGPSSKDRYSPFLRPLLYLGPYGEAGTVKGICLRLEGKTIRDKYRLNTGFSTGLVLKVSVDCAVLFSGRGLMGMAEKNFGIVDVAVGVVVGVLFGDEE